MADENDPLNQVLSKVVQLSPTELSVLAETVESLQGKGKAPGGDPLIFRTDEPPSDDLLKHRK